MREGQGPRPLHLWQGERRGSPVSSWPRMGLGVPRGEPSRERAVRRLHETSWARLSGVQQCPLVKVNRTHGKEISTALLMDVALCRSEFGVQVAPVSPYVIVAGAIIRPCRMTGIGCGVWSPRRSRWGESSARMRCWLAEILRKAEVGSLDYIHGRLARRPIQSESS
jgi:hypothetical protein